VMGSRSKIFGPARVSHFLVWKISPENPQIFNFSPLGGSKNFIGSGQKVPGSKRGRTSSDLLRFNVRVGSGRDLENI